MNELIQFLRKGNEAGGFGTDDVLAAMLPLLEEVNRLHDTGFVADLEGANAIRVRETSLFLVPEAAKSPRRNMTALGNVQHQVSSAIELLGENRRTIDLNEGAIRFEDLLIGVPGELPKRPVFYPGYVGWEHVCGHHDQLTDIHSLGLLLASFACSLDLSDAEDLQTFVANRNNLFAINERLHPVVASVVVQMTELNRQKRIQSLNEVLHRLKNYRDQAADQVIDFKQLKGFHAAGANERSRLILNHLRNRLFEVSRRNRLIYFRQSQQSINLTIASVPLLLDVRNIRTEQLFIWHADLASSIAKGDSINLGKYVRFEDAVYAGSVLDQIISTEKKDRNEFGFSQLRLVICFLHWHNLRDAAEEKIHSPLLLVPVEVTRKKGVRDAYILRALTSEAEVNPALRHHLNQLYGLDLPPIIDLEETSLDEFHATLAQLIKSSEPGVTLRKQDRPQIDFIFEKAKQRMDQFKRKQRLRRRTASATAIDSSYDKERFRPRGLQLFLHRVKPSPLPFAQALGAAPIPRRPYLIGTDEGMGVGENETREEMLFSLKETADSGNPYEWVFDLCSQTLGNFNYRKMSLVRDYASLIERGSGGKAFESVFSLVPKPLDQAALEVAPLVSQFPVVECDPTQTRAVSQARNGFSYIIQGPPGTGKSQTITNLIADYVARGKRVLFVCEKRAAIDVVYHRLGRQGLDELCCLIHDSQTDKKEFIKNLKATYEDFIAKPIDGAAETQRTDLLRLIAIEIDAFKVWSEAHSQKLGCSDLSCREVISRMIELRDSVASINAVQEEMLPAIDQWQASASLARSLESALGRTRTPVPLAHHPFRFIATSILTGSKPVAEVTDFCDEALRILAEVEKFITNEEEAPLAKNFGLLREQAEFAQEIETLIANDSLDLLAPKSAASLNLTRLFAELRNSEKALVEATARTTSWRGKLENDATSRALEQAKRFESSIFKWLSPSFWSLRKTMLSSCDFSGGKTALSWTQALENLNAEHIATRALERAKSNLASALGGISSDAAQRWVEERAATLKASGKAVRQLHSYLCDNPEAVVFAQNLVDLRSELVRLGEMLSRVRIGYQEAAISDLMRDVRALRDQVAWLPDLVPLLVELQKAPQAVQNAIREIPISSLQLERAVMAKCLANVKKGNEPFAVTSGPVLAARVGRLQTYLREFQRLNALVIRRGIRRRFLEKVRITTLPAAQLTDGAQKELKKRYATGRRELEHEFSKSMRHRSIRDLADDETGEVLRDLKPIWLMSPLSVADTLPLDERAFDVVIFDEASQILMEEAVPAVARASQIIVVGDEMQLPPTNFFSASRSVEDDPTEEDSISEDLDAESFLTQSARSLPATMLGWHYRSRSEALISYSNHAFYQGRLLTIPDRIRASVARPELQHSNEFSDFPKAAEELLRRSVSFHYMDRAVYANRTNQAEAEYIAGLLREILNQDSRPSVGIVAFSEAQQGEIESAIEQLGESDSDFQNRVEREYEREDEGQFNGLFVKNLENVQGDERDIILLSICYGYDANRRMLMNFGPINQRGGEKRLNVIFSRARRNMAVVSSIRHTDITNDYNEGAACLKRFLEYASASSIGNMETARRVLMTANAGMAPSHAAGAQDVVVRELCKALREKNWEVEESVGQSTFRIPIAVRASGAETYSLGILVDNSDHYAQGDLVERYCQRPAVLRAFGWKLISIYAKDWLENSNAVIARIEGLLTGEDEIEVQDVEIPVISAPVSSEPYPNVSTDVLSVAEDPIPSVPAPSEMPNSRRRYIYLEDDSKKFWEVAVDGARLFVRFGRLGTKGQLQVRSFETRANATREMEKLIRSKVSKGYVEE